jgi:SAM-dependent methyltransferase
MGTRPRESATVATAHDVLYDRSFYAGLEAWARDSAEQIVPIVLDLVKPQSVVDVGCGTGAWLAAFADHGVSRYLGIDGPHVDRDTLRIDPSRFTPADLTAPLSIGAERFDLALSLEVAEHLPEARAAGFLDTLVTLAPVVLFSAAIPLQGGVNHVNERWQSYWARLFGERGFVVVDAIRPRVWGNPKVASFYAQNMFLYVRDSVLREHHALNRERDRTAVVPLDAVHPRHYLVYASNQHLSCATVVKLLPRLLGAGLARKWQRIWSTARLRNGR